jgi:hypothetical protein
MATYKSRLQNEGTHVKNATLAMTEVT